jgi:hypothetical protein
MKNPWLVCFGAFGLMAVALAQGRAQAGEST